VSKEVAYGRCRSGQRWFWFAGEYHPAWEEPAPEPCGDPVCGDGRLHPHRYGWEDTADAALEAMRSAVTELGGSVTYNPSGLVRHASAALKRINTVRRAARPAKGEEPRSAPVEYLYSIGFPFHVIAYRITKKTPRRIYYLREAGDAEWGESQVTGFIDRQDFESGPCPGLPYQDRPWCKHGYGHTHGLPAGQIRTETGGEYGDGLHLFASREAAEDLILRSKRRMGGDPQAGKPGHLKRLRAAMLKAHPDAGGSDEAFIKARSAYEQELALVRQDREAS
jgi:hypothetical protein